MDCNRTEWVAEDVTEERCLFPSLLLLASLPLPSNTASVVGGCSSYSGGNITELANIIVLQKKSRCSCSCSRDILSAADHLACRVSSLTNPSTSGSNISNIAWYSVGRRFQMRLKQAQMKRRFFRSPVLQLHGSASEKLFVTKHSSIRSMFTDFIHCCSVIAYLVAQLHVQHYAIHKSWHACS